MRQSISKICPAVLFLLCLFAAPAQTHADPITITTTGQFSVNGGPGSSSVTYGSGGDTVTLTFVGVNNSWTNPPVNSSGAIATSFGQVQVSVTGNGATIAPGTLLNLSGTQTGSPLGNFNFSFIARVEGTITQGGSNARLVFPLTYSLIQLQGGGYTWMVFTVDHVNGAFVNLAPPGVNGGVTNVNGTAGPIPEPGTVALLGTGLAGLAARARRRRRRH